jgi:hypothetical protein
MGPHLNCIKDGGHSTEWAVFRISYRNSQLASGKKTLRVRVAETFLVICSVCIATIACEAAYRVYLDVWISSSLGEASARNQGSFKAVNDTYMISDPVFGFRFRQGISTYTTAYLKDNLFDHCETNTFRADQSEISGIYEGDYASADLKILVFGDSFTAMQFDGVTWPELLQRRLEERLRRRVRVVNFARFAQGVLQMTDIAATTVPQWRPNFYVIAYITNDLVRPRFWLVNRKLRGYERALIMMSPHAEPDPVTMTDVADYFQVNAKVTGEWCDHMTSLKAEYALQQLKEDPVSRDLISEHETLREENTKPLLKTGVWGRETFGTSFLYDRIVRGNPMIGLLSAMPRVGFRGVMALDRFDEDNEFRAAVERLRETGIPGILIHLPHIMEISKGTEFLYREDGGMADAQGASLRESLERAFGVKSIGLVHRLSEEGSDPGAYVLSASDPHPNRLGLQLYADAIALALSQQGLLKAAP